MSANLDKATKILEMFEAMESGKSDFTAPSDIAPLTMQDRQFMLDELRAFGLGGGPLP